MEFANFFAQENKNTQNPVKIIILWALLTQNTKNLISKTENLCAITVLPNLAPLFFASTLAEFFKVAHVLETAQSFSRTFLRGLKFELKRASQIPMWFFAPFSVVLVPVDGLVGVLIALSCKGDGG